MCTKPEVKLKVPEDLLIILHNLGIQSFLSTNKLEYYMLYNIKYLLRVSHYISLK